VLETVALVNTGFETPNPQILLLVKAAEKLKLRPNLPPDALVETYDTAGGPTRVYRVRNAVKVEVKWDSRLGLPIPPKTSCQHP
jgi:hypothetical protein